MSSYKEVKLPDTPRLTCGAVGYMGYDTIQLIENSELGLEDLVVNARYARATYTRSADP